MKKLLLPILLSFTLYTANASDRTTTDTLTLTEAFKKSSWQGFARSYFMATDNSGTLTDHYAWGVLGALEMQTARYKRFQAGVRMSFSYNLLSSDLAAPDPQTGQPSRYEVGLFDIENPSQTTVIRQLEKLYLKYNIGKKSSVTWGKQFLFTPFVNPHDGRLAPNYEEGIWADIQELPNTRIQAGWLYRMLIRSTTRWATIGESIGLYPTGAGVLGGPSGYRGNLYSDGIFILSVAQKLPHKFDVEFWNYYVDNIFNTAMLQAGKTFAINGPGLSQIRTDVQIIRQDPIRDGGHPDLRKTYFSPEHAGWTFSGRVGMKYSKWYTEWAYTRISAQGRFLMPREWGREPLFTFMPRERQEGLGDLHAVTWKNVYQPAGKPYRVDLTAGYFHTPDARIAELNKYGMPSYTQVNLNLTYQFTGALKGMDAQLLIVHKGRVGEYHDNLRFVINKNDMVLYNFVVNYRF